MRSKDLSYGEIGINKNAFHKAATSISTDEIEFIFFIKLHMVIKVYLNIILDIDTKMEPFHH